MATEQFAAPPGAWVRRAPRPLGIGVLLLLAALPAVLGVLALLLDDDDHLPLGDIAISELAVRDIGQHEVLLGPYSRFGWHHPGPMEAYVLAVPYRLLDGAHESLAVGALAVAGISLVAAVLLVRRHAGFLAAVWTLLVLMVSVRMLGADFLHDSWNPLLPVLPLLAGALLCWAAVRGSAWALPVAVLPLSLAVQSHIGYLAPVVAVGVVLVAGLGVRRFRRLPAGQWGGKPRPRPAGRWLIAAGAAVGIALVLWLPPIIQQVTGDPRNGDLLLDYLRNGTGEAATGFPTGLRVVADEFGKLPVYLTGGEPPEASLLPERWPAWAIAVGLLCFGASLVVAALRRREEVLWLGAFTLAVAAAGVAAVARLEGLPFFYITRWTVVIGVLAWVTVGLGLLPEVVLGIRRAVAWAGQGSRAEVVLGVPLTALATTAVLVTGVGVACAEMPSTDPTGEVVELEAAVVDDLDGLGLTTAADPPVVRVEFAPTTRSTFLGTSFAGTGLLLELVRDGIDARGTEEFRLQLGLRYTQGAEVPGYVATLAYADGTSPPPQPWQRVLAVGAEYQVYGGVPPS
ncbi:hypothetical protein [Blastococcus sp. URHD0036]|uniref:hypothetical protein n=1 Tax=Blastococcus sp. URHD0036 TaxID=1380356 RepID=UPI000496CBE6|nr:hypothetical protein [Blastococcus sp. URHD0036]